MVVSAPLGELIRVQVGAAGLAHCSYRTHFGFDNGRGQGRPLFVWEGSGWYMQYHQWSVEYSLYIQVFVSSCGP